MTLVFVTVVSTLLVVIAAASPSSALVGAYIPTHVADSAWRNPCRRISNHRCAAVFGPTLLSSNAFTGLGHHGIAKQNPFKRNTAKIATTFMFLVDEKQAKAAAAAATTDSPDAAKQDQDPTTTNVDPVTATDGIDEKPSVVQRIRKWIVKRWIIFTAAALLVAFVRYGAVGRLEVAPFLPLKKAETLSDWSCLAVIYGVFVALLGGIMGFNIADTAAAVQAKNREEDQKIDKDNRKDDQAREDELRNDDRTREDELRKDDRTREDELRNDDRSHEEKLREEDRTERRMERLEDAIRDLKREMRLELLPPSEKQAISKEIEEKSKKLKEVELKLDRIRQM